MNNEQLVSHHNKFKMGTGSYQFVGVWSAPSKGLLEQNPVAYNNWMRSKPKCCHFSCDHCGTGIVHHFILQDSNGDNFAVGSSCISHLGDSKLITVAHKAELDRQRKARADKKAREQAERHAKYEAELEAQRERNGGLTDNELKRENAKKEESRMYALRGEIAKPVTDVLEQQSSPFCFSVATDIRSGYPLSGNQRRIIIEIMAKQYGRKNSKAYKEALPQCEALFNTVYEKLREVK